MGKVTVGTDGRVILKTGNVYTDVFSGKHVGTSIDNNFYASDSNKVYSRAGNVLVDTETGESVGINVGNKHFRHNDGTTYTKMGK